MRSLLKGKNLLIGGGGGGIFLALRVDPLLRRMAKIENGRVTAPEVYLFTLTET